VSSGKSISFRASCDNDGMLSVSWGSIRGITKDVKVMFVWEQWSSETIMRALRAEVSRHVRHDSSKSYNL